MARKTVKNVHFFTIFSFHSITNLICFDLDTKLCSLCVWNSRPWCQRLRPGILNAVDRLDLGPPGEYACCSKLPLSCLAPDFCSFLFSYRFLCVFQ